LVENLQVTVGFYDIFKGGHYFFLKALQKIANFFFFAILNQFLKAPS
jgi:hypothetical protein